MRSQDLIEAACRAAGGETWMAWLRFKNATSELKRVQVDRDFVTAAVLERNERLRKFSAQLSEIAVAMLSTDPQPAAASDDEPVAWLDAAADDVISATQKLRWERSGRWKLVAEDYKTPLYIRPQAAESKAEQRMSALYKVVSEVVASDDRAINITRLHDYLSGEDIPASAVVCAAERVPLSDEQIADIELAINGNSIRAFTVRHIVRLVEVAHGIKDQS